jgi:DNA-binding NarL/FixJ family response regulator
MQNILIADDHAVTRRGIREILHDAFPGVTTEEAADAPGLLAILSARPWDLILLDALMPGGSVLDTLGRIRATHPLVPVLVLTAATEIEYLVHAMRAGANGLIHKHRASDDLLEAIKTVAKGGNYIHPESARDLAATLRGDPALPHERLSGREREIFARIAQGRSVKEIAAELALSDKTVATYLARIREKTGLNSHVEIARYALQHRIVD